MINCACKIFRDTNRSLRLLFEKRAVIALLKQYFRVLVYFEFKKRAVDSYKTAINTDDIEHTQHLYVEPIKQTNSYDLQSRRSMADSKTATRQTQFVISSSASAPFPKRP